ncbi:Protein of uncharacterised function (DUF535) [Citrobacter freundii]|uniref:VirK/YbjX family protein n=1 Tax=Citrobacter sp. TaxID=1896336 RepID=UPI000DF0E82C|nr:Protein of uncharacterised function (DUF535) [Citrobacter freundii]
MKSVTFLRFLSNIIFVRGPLYGKWKNRKFRLMYLLRCLINPFSSVRYYHELCSLQSINKILEIQPTLPAKIHRPYLYKGGLAETRRKNIIGHYRFIQDLPSEYQTFLFPDRDVLLTHFTGKKGEDFYIYCSSGGFDREGELMLSLCFKEIPVARLSFSIIPTSKGHCAFIGGLQGAPRDIGPDIIRDATKSCYGLFPKRIVFEALCSLMSCCDIADVLAVSEQSHVFRQLRYRYKKRKCFVAIYSDFWESVSGRPYGNLYQLPIYVERKSFNELASKKRSEYRKRYSLLDQIHEDIRRLLKREAKE